MSLARLVRRRGSRVTVYRPTPSENADGSVAAPTWSEVASDVPLLFEPLTDSLASEIYGAATQIRDRGFTAQLDDIRPADGLLVTVGHRLGDRYLVEEANEYHHNSRHRHLELGVVQTREVFP